MHRVSLRLGAALIVAGVLAFPGSALAAEATATGTIEGGSLSLTTSAAPTFSATLDGTDKTATYNLPLRVEDLTGSGAGWNTTITSTQFTTGGENAKTLATSASSLTAVTSECVEEVTCTDPTNAISYPVSVPAGSTAPEAVKFFDAAAGTGMGKFSLNPTVSVSIPANTYAGTYTSTITLASVSGP